MKSIKNETKKLKEDLLKKFKRKVEHLTNVQRKRQEHQKKTIQTVTPLNLRKYSSLTIFEPSTSFPEREKSLGPYICDPNIALSQEEREILSKQPKFSVREEIKEIEVLAETERMLVKHRLNENSTKMKKKQKNKLHGLLFQTQQQEIKKGMEKEKEREKRISEVWKDNESRFIYNPLKGNIDFNSARPTDYTINKHMYLPKPLSIEEEFECEIRKKKYMSAFKEYREEMEASSDNMKAKNPKNKKERKKERET